MSAKEYAAFAADLYQELRLKQMRSAAHGTIVFDHGSAIELTRTVLRAVAAQREAA